MGMTGSAGQVVQPQPRVTRRRATVGAQPAAPPANPTATPPANAGLTGSTPWWKVPGAASAVTPGSSSIGWNPLPGGEDPTETWNPGDQKTTPTGPGTPTSNPRPDWWPDDLPWPGDQPTSTANAQVANSGGWDPYLKAWMDAIGQQNNRQWREDEYNQWIGPNGYVRRGDPQGPGGRAIAPWGGGSAAVDDYWSYRLGTHARGDYNGDNPAELGPPPGSTSTNSSSNILSILQSLMASGYGSAPSAAVPQASAGSIMDRINELLDNGGRFDQSLVNNRVESAREALEGRRKGELEGDRAELAARGLLGSGAEISALSRLSNDMTTDFSGTIRDIYSDESAAANDRYAEALSLATGMTIEDAKNAVAMAQIASTERIANARNALDASLGFGRLDLDRALGFGGLDLQRLGLMNNYNLGVGRLNLDRDLGAANLSQTSDSSVLAILQMLLGLGGQIGGGYI